MKPIASISFAQSRFPGWTKWKRYIKGVPHRTPVSLLFWIVFLASPTLAVEPILTLKGGDGKEIKGTVSPGKSNEFINLVRSDGVLFRDIPLNSFSPDSREMILARIVEIKKELGNADVTKDSKLRISFQRGKSDRMNDFGDIDNRIVKVQPSITIKNDDFHRRFPDVSGEVIIIGKEAVRKDTWVILSRQAFKISEILPDGLAKWEGKQFECEYDPDFGGFDYEGYVIILKDKSGKVVIRKGSSPNWEAATDAILAARKMTGYDRTFSNTKTLRTTFGLPRE